MPRWLIPGALLCAALANLAAAQSSTEFDGQYMGKLTLTNVVSGDCTEPPPGALYPLRISSGQVQFKYVPRFDTILQGMINNKGIFTASQRVRGGLVSMTGRVQGNNVSALVSSPSCRYTFKTQN